MRFSLYWLTTQIAHKIYVNEKVSLRALSNAEESQFFYLNKEYGNNILER